MEWKSSITEVDAVTKEFTVSIPADKFGTETESAMAGFVQQTKLKGFRPGKAPRHLVEKLHGEQVRVEVAHRLVSTSLGDLIKEHKLEVVGVPDVKLGSIELGKEIQYTAKVSIFPSPEISGYDKFSVKVAKRELKEADIDSVIENMRDQRATPQKLAFRNVAQKGDVAEGTLSVKVEDEGFSTPEPFAILLGKAQLPAEVEEQIVGMEIGQTKEIPSALPENYPQKELQGKKAIFKISLNGLSERVLPELTDEFAKSLNLEVGSVLELRMKVRKQLEDMHARDTKKDTQAAALDHLIAKNDFLVPQAMIDEEIRELLVRYGLLDPRKTDVSRVSVDPFREQLGATAMRRVKGAIVVDQIGRKEKLTPTDDDINKAVEEIAAENKVTADEVRQFILSSERRAGFLVELTRNKALEFISERATIEFSAPEEAAAEEGAAPSTEKKKKKSK